MASSLITICLHLLFFLVVCGSVPSPPTYGNSYEVEATIYLPYAEIAEPIHVKYDAPNNRSRVDYYGGIMTEMDKTVGSGLPNGAHYIFAPLTNKEVYNKFSCFQSNGSAPGDVSLINVIPDLTVMEFLGNGTYFNTTVNIFRYVQTVGSKKNTYTFMSDVKTSMPVFYEMMGFDSLIGSHFDKYYVVYTKVIMPGSFTDKDFEPPSGVSCKAFPGPGVKSHLISHSPIREFVHHEEFHVDQAFEDFKKNHGKTYTGFEHNTRKNTFRQNFRYINSKNRAGLSYTMKVNHMADRTEKEMKYLRGYRYTHGKRGGQTFIRNFMKINDLPDQFDWQLLGAVTPVKDQAICGSCWSFGTTGTIEGAYFLKYGNLTRFSQQELIDCSWGFGNNGCDGGEDFRSYQWIMDNGGLTSMDQYGPYKAIDSYCKKNDVKPVVQLKNYTLVPPGKLDDLKIAIYNKGPISVAIDASHKSLSFYANGVYYEPKCRNDPDGLDHAVLAVGYGTLNGEDYWLVKNSWSTYWGNDGYVLMSQKDNNCGVATAASYVEVV